MPSPLPASALPSLSTTVHSIQSLLCRDFPCHKLPKRALPLETIHNLLLLRRTDRGGTLVHFRRKTPLNAPMGSLYLAGETSSLLLADWTCPLGLVSRIHSLFGTLDMVGGFDEYFYVN